MGSAGFSYSEMAPPGIARFVPVRGTPAGVVLGFLADVVVEAGGMAVGVVAGGLVWLMEPRRTPASRQREATVTPMTMGALLFFRWECPGVYGLGSSSRCGPSRVSAADGRRSMAVAGRRRRPAGHGGRPHIERGVTGHGRLTVGRRLPGLHRGGRRRGLGEHAGVGHRVLQQAHDHLLRRGPQRRISSPGAGPPRRAADRAARFMSGWWFSTRLITAGIVSLPNGERTRGGETRSCFPRGETGRPTSPTVLAHHLLGRHVRGGPRRLLLSSRSS